VPKQLYEMSRERDEGGQSLMPYPERIQEDYARGARWEPGTYEALATGRINQPRKSQSLDAQPWDVQRRIRRGRGLHEKGRMGTIKENGDRYDFQVQTTEEFRRERWPLDRKDGYHGHIKMEGGRLAGGECDCPDYQENAIQWRGFTLCKHMVWASYRVLEGDYMLDSRISVWLKWSDEAGCNVIEKVEEHGETRKTSLSAREMRKHLSDAGYTQAERVAWFEKRRIQEVYAKYAT